MSSDALLRLTDVNVKIGRNTVLSVDDLFVSSQPGIASVFIGPNGAGKTSAINAITGYATMSKGAKIEFESEGDVAHRSPAHIVRVGIARTFQAPASFPSLTSLEVLSVAGRFSGRCSLPEKQYVSAALDLLRGLGLETGQENRSLPLARLRRLELARALITGPRLLLLDEPTAGLDEGEKDWLKDFLCHHVRILGSELHDRGVSRFPTISIGLVTHDMAFLHTLKAASALQQATTHFMNLGRVVSSGPLEDVLSQPIVDETYFGH